MYDLPEKLCDALIEGRNHTAQGPGSVGQGSEIWVSANGKRYFSPPRCSDTPWCAPGLLSDGEQALVPWLNGQIPKRNTHPHLVPWLLTNTLPHSVSHSPNHSLTQSISHSFTHPLNHSLTQSLNHSLTQSLTHSPNLSLTHSPTQALTQSLTHSISH